MGDHSNARTVAVRVFVALLVLTGLTTGASYMDLGVLGLPVAILIACTKAMLVLTYFMHLKGNLRLLWVVVAAGFLFFLLLYIVTLSDYLTRSSPPQDLVVPLEQVRR